MFCVAASRFKAQVPNTITENDDEHLQVSLTWHGVRGITDASSKLLVHRPAPFLVAQRAGDEKLGRGLGTRLLGCYLRF